MKAFVTGADGFIGSHLCEALRDAGHEVTGLALYGSHDSLGWLDEVEGVATVRGDVRDAGFMREAVKGHEVVFHLAAIISVPQSFASPETFIDTNVKGTLNVLMAARAADARVVHTSTSEVYGTAQYAPQDEAHPISPQSPYAASKVAADALVQAFRLSYGMSAVTLRPFNTYGPRQSERAVIASICRQMADPQCTRVQIGNPNAVRDFVFVSDTVRAFLAVMKLDGGIYNVATGKGTRIDSLAPSKDRHMRSFAAERLRPANAEVGELIGSAEALRQATGWRPLVGLDEGFAVTLGWWESRGYRKSMAYVA